MPDIFNEEEKEEKEEKEENEEEKEEEKKRLGKESLKKEEQERLDKENKLLQIQKNNIKLQGEQEEAAAETYKNYMGGGAVQRTNPENAAHENPVAVVVIADEQLPANIKNYTNKIVLYLLLNLTLIYFKVVDFETVD